MESAVVTYNAKRPRVGAVAGCVEYDGPDGTRVRKEFPAIGGGAARRFYVAQSQAGKNPRLVKSPPAVR